MKDWLEELRAEKRRQARSPTLPDPAAMHRDMAEERLAGRALARLTDAERAALCLFEFAGFDPLRAGQAMGLPPEVADTLRAQALRKLAHHIRE